MLPDGFKWREHLGGPAIFLDGNLLAHVTPLEGGCRVCVSPDRWNMRYRFFASMDTSVCFVEAWAVKWQDQIRQEAGAGRMTP